MALRKPLVMVAGEIQQLQSGDSIGEVQLITLSHAGASPTAVGDVMYIVSAGTVTKARADAGATMEAFYFATAIIANAASGPFQSSGVLGGFVGLTAGATYYLSTATAGAMTTTAPTATGQYVVRLGKALSTTEFEIRIERPVLL